MKKGFANRVLKGGTKRQGQKHEQYTLWILDTVSLDKIGFWHSRALTVGYDLNFQPRYTFRSLPHRVVLFTQFSGMLRSHSFLFPSFFFVANLIYFYVSRGSVLLLNESGDALFFCFSVSLVHSHFSASNLWWEGLDLVMKSVPVGFLVSLNNKLRGGGINYVVIEGFLITFVPISFFFICLSYNLFASTLHILTPKYIKYASR